MKDNFSVVSLPCTTHFKLRDWILYCIGATKVSVPKKPSLSSYTSGFSFKIFLFHPSYFLYKYHPYRCKHKVHVRFTNISQMLQGATIQWCLVNSKSTFFTQTVEEHWTRSSYKVLGGVLEEPPQGKYYLILSFVNFSYKIKVCHWDLLIICYWDALCTQKGTVLSY